MKKTEIAPFENKCLENIKGEKWKEIPGLEGFYLISNFGRVKSLPRYIEKINAIKGYWTRERILSLNSSSKKVNQFTHQSNAYLAISIMFENKQYSFSIARLVYTLFIKEINLDKVEYVVKPIDGNGLNCCSSNLELSTYSEHMKSCYKKGQLLPAYQLNPSRFKNFIEASRPVKRICQYDNKGKLLKVFKNQRIASLKTGIHNSLINSALKKKVNTAGTYIWRYEGERFGNNKIRKERASLNGNNRIVSQYNMEGKRVGIFYSIKAAEQATGANTSQIIRSTRSKYLSAKGFFWKVGEGPKKIDVSAYWHRINKNLRSKSYKVEQYDLEGKKLNTFNSINEASRHTGIIASTITRAAKKKSKTFGGYLWIVR